MNARERFLATLLIAIMFIAAGGFLGYQFVFLPLKKANEDAAKLQDEVTKLESDKDAIEGQRLVYENKTKKKSLPLDATLAQREYQRLLDRMLRNAGFQAPQIQPRSPSAQNVPTIGGKKTPIYTKLDFDVRVKGELETLVDFLHSFYRQPLLHQIRLISLLKPTQRGQQQGGELEVTLTIEALVLDKAENRPTLMPAITPVALAFGGAASAGLNFRATESGRGALVVNSGVLARGEKLSRASADDEYRSIARKDIFFGYPPQTKQVERPEPEADLAPFVVLTTVSHGSGQDFASIRDRYHKYDYEIVVDAKGTVNVSKYWYSPLTENGIAGELRHKCHNDINEASGYYDSRYLTFGSEEKGNERSYIVRRIVEDGIVVQEYDSKRVRLMKYAAPAILGGTANLALPGKLSHWRVGQVIKSEETGKSMAAIVLTDEMKKNKGLRTSADAARHELVRPLELLNEPSEDESQPKKEEPVVPKKKFYFPKKGF